MSRKKTPRISTEAAPNAGWEPFAGLELEGLPSGAPEPAATAQAGKKQLRGRVRLRRSTAHRGGKVVTVVEDLPANVTAAEVEDLASLLRKRCNTGGTVRERTIELQGDRVDQLRALLEEQGFQIL